MTTKSITFYITPKASARTLAYLGPRIFGYLMIGCEIQVKLVKTLPAGQRSDHYHIQDRSVASNRAIKQCKNLSGAE